MSDYPNPIVLRTNADWRDAVRLVEVAPDQTETPLDLTGASMRMHIRSASPSRSVFLELSTANSRLVITDAVNGVYATNVDKAEIAAALPPGSYVCDLHVQIGDIDLVPLIREVEVELGVTR